jgi:aminopeptidase N
VTVHTPTQAVPQSGSQPPAAAATAAPVTTNEGHSCTVGAYTPFPFTVPQVHLDVSIRPGTTTVTSVVDYVPLDTNPGQQELQLQGEDLELLELCLDGEW